MKNITLPLLSLVLAAPFTARAQHINVGLGFHFGPPPPVRVYVAPPPPVREAIYASPGAGYVWIPGHYALVNGQWAWMRGQWTLPPQPGAYWVAGNWDQAHNWIESHWEVVQAPPPPPPEYYAPPPQGAPVEEVYVDGPPPPPLEVNVVAGPRPSPYHVWINGYWGWDGGRRRWVASHWELPPHGHGAWVEPRWEHREGRYVYVRGYWR